ncbi:uncharacterized protein METZ01_LOCUS40163, partial [marine metagenome]
MINSRVNSSDFIPRAFNQAITKGDFMAVISMKQFLEAGV